MEAWQRREPTIAVPWVKGEAGAVGQELAGWWEEAYHTGAHVPVNAFTAMQASAVMACVSILAEDVAKLPCGIYRRLPNGGSEPATDHPLFPLLRAPNDWQTWFEYSEFMTAALVLRGNAYAVKLRDGRGKVTAKVPIHPDRVALYESPGGEWFYLVTRNGLHEMAVLRETPLLVPSDDMFHLRWLSQWNSLLGSSRVGLMRESIGLAMVQTLQASRFAGSGTRPSGVFQTDQKLNQDVIDRLREQWQETYGGWRNTGKTVFLEQGLKWQQLGMTSVDAQFLESRRFQVEEIARIFRVPPHKIGILQRGTASSLVQQDQDYLNSVLLSYIERWEARLERDFDIDGVEYFVQFDVTRFLRADIQTRYNAYRTGIVGGFLTPNEARRAEGLPDQKGGDVLLQPSNIVPMGTPPAAGAAGPGSDVTGGPAAGGDGDPAAVPDDSDDSASSD